ncbi:hypothetical protein HPB48_013907 [Haemaphysalis longicornis]|uniref:Elongation factor-like GTPase 1 domain-containing protein n=1 Tax=Haemaphysalis longicornis TaxID=44386 RepID=A0A9J6FUQ5_HAELO|nr:hypothetical protein HPB48_013907 [Haemaphysalis longicornis]
MLDTARLQFHHLQTAKLVQSKKKLHSFVFQDEDDEDVAEDGTVTIRTPNQQVTIKLRAEPLPQEVTELLEKHTSLIRDYNQALSSRSEKLPESLSKNVAEFQKTLGKAFADAGWPDETMSQIWSFGPRRRWNSVKGALKEALHRAKEVQEQNDCSEESGRVQLLSVTAKGAASGQMRTLAGYDHSFVSGFQLATLTGPLCQEPMMGVAFVVDQWDLDLSVEDPGTYGPLSGQIISAVKEGCRRAFQAQPQRLLCAMYSCNIQVTSEALREWLLLFFLSFFRE